MGRSNRSPFRWTLTVSTISSWQVADGEIGEVDSDDAPKAALVSTTAVPQIAGIGDPAVPVARASIHMRFCLTGMARHHSSTLFHIAADQISRRQPRRSAHILVNLRDFQRSREESTEVRP